ncbi:Uncharacterised protein [Mycobacterium tuberculosis]|uniref:Uncharacterized protein n=1 Tax=Mycobacterium tuberculosis TaxID=1773 RepID=A0A654ZMU5_MYCTX|nr:Uncharacterised protein [Mycobacterium tuberculosis]CNU89103.1 Uncharacterised protein [Mycobacterium tuberculosis]COX43144.1 Uncharacterised protein [Mycobacterium tuberculosis]
MRHQPVEKTPLPLEQFGACPRYRKPAHPVDLGELTHLARALRPVQFEGAASCVGDVQIRPDTEHGHHLAAGLFQRPEVDSRPVRHAQPDLLGELAPGGQPRIFAAGVFALRDRPSAVVLSRPKRAARMRQKDVDDTGARPIQQHTRAELGHEYGFFRSRRPVPDPSATIPGAQAAAASGAHCDGTRPVRSRDSQHCSPG